MVSSIASFYKEDELLQAPLQAQSEVNLMEDRLQLQLRLHRLLLQLLLSLINESELLGSGISDMLKMGRLVRLLRFFKHHSLLVSSKFSVSKSLQYNLEINFLQIFAGILLCLINVG